MAVSPYDPIFHPLPAVTPDQQQLLDALETQIDDDLRAEARRNARWMAANLTELEPLAEATVVLHLLRAAPDEEPRGVQGWELTPMMRRWLRLRYRQAGWRAVELRDVPGGSVQLAVSL